MTTVIFRGIIYWESTRVLCFKSFKCLLWFTLKEIHILRVAYQVMIKNYIAIPKALSVNKILFGLDGLSLTTSSAIY